MPRRDPRRALRTAKRETNKRKQCFKAAFGIVAVFITCIHHYLPELLLGIPKLPPFDKRAGLGASVMPVTIAFTTAPAILGLSTHFEGIDRTYTYVDWFLNLDLDVRGKGVNVKKKARA